jgi:glutaredoxin-like protein NrdH
MTTAARIYSLPHCSGCRQTKLLFDRLGLNYTEVDLPGEPEVTEIFKLIGLVAAPIVVVQGDQWSGFRPDKIGALMDSQ